MSSCQSSHDSCNPPGGQKRVPTRLIDISLGDGTLDVALREAVSATNPYIALSYCWGLSLPLRTLRSNLESHKNRIAWNDLPVLFKDAIHIARLLQVRYIWIDALCIIQDSMVDWSIEGANMSDYYGDALLTLAADTVPDTTATCFPRPTSQSVVLSISDGSKKVKVTKIPVHVSMKSIRFEKNPPLCMPLFSRAWAFQERLMSVRTLHLGPEELVWECSSELWCECGMPPDIWNGRPEKSIQPFRVSHYHALDSGTDLGGYWHDLIEIYLIRQLTFGRDKLNAIMGLAKQINNSQNTNSPPLGNYILGFWSSSLENSLLWSKSGSGYSRNSQFPSWSWASIDGTWLYQRPPPLSAFVSKAVILRTPPESWTTDLAKEARNYGLVISGYATDAVLVASNIFPGRNQAQWTLRTGSDCDNDMELVVSLDIDLDYKKGDKAVEVTCLQLGVSEIRSKQRSWGLVLRATSHKNAGFERIGIMTASESWYKTISKRREIKIV